VADDGRAIKRNREVHLSQLDGRGKATFGESWVDPRYGRGGVLEILAKAEEVASLAPVIRRALKNLTPRQRRIVTLWYREGLTNKEIARELGLNEHTVSSHLCEGRKRLRRFLDRTESDELRRRKDAVAARGFERCRTAPRPASAPMFRLPKAPAKHAKA
jgi:DNA-directed RNA polymerase specialized sigma24 family protein